VDGDELPEEKKDQLNEVERVEPDWNEMNAAIVDYSNDYIYKKIIYC
jgi:hypothetical protein